MYNSYEDYKEDKSMDSHLKLLNWQNITSMDGRENLGVEMPVMVYRLMQYGIFDELSDLYSPETAKDIIRGAGWRVGMAVGENALDKTQEFSVFVGQLQKLLKDLKIGVLKIEDIDEETNEFILTVAEDLDCSGLPLLDETICYYDEGFIAGVLEFYTGEKYVVREVDCWASGDRVCRFKAYQG